MQKHMLEQKELASYVFGAQDIVFCDDGFIQPKRFSRAQEQVLRQRGIGDKAEHSAGILLKFTTSATYISFDVRLKETFAADDPLVCEAMRVTTTTSDPYAAGLFDGIDVVVDAQLYQTFAAKTARCCIDLSGFSKQEHTVEIFLPCMSSVCVGRFSADAPMHHVQKRSYLLALGDSITQGTLIGHPSQTWAASLARKLDYDFCNQALAGYHFDVQTLYTLDDMQEAPACIFVAYGTNDWAHESDSAKIEHHAYAYMQRLVEIFPETPIFVIAPLWRADIDNVTVCDRPLSWVEDMLYRITEDFSHVSVLSGDALLPHIPALFSEMRIHPNVAGAQLLAQNIYTWLETHAHHEQNKQLAYIDAEHIRRASSPKKHDSFDSLVRTVWRLRQTDGCPWDKEQTHESITKNMIEEAYEAVDAIEQQDVEHMQEELGDVLEQVLLHAQIAADAGEFDIDDICQELNEKLVCRHEHVFGSLKNPRQHSQAENAREALDAWGKVKLSEHARQQEQTSIMDSVPKALPALLQAQKLNKKAQSCGFAQDDLCELWDILLKKIDAIVTQDASHVADENGAKDFGEILFILTCLAQRLDIDTESALRTSCSHFVKHWKRMEDVCQQRRVTIEGLSAREQKLLWEKTEQQESDC